MDRENDVGEGKAELRWGVEQRLEFIEFRLFCARTRLSIWRYVSANVAKRHPVANVTLRILDPSVSPEGPLHA